MQYHHATGRYAELYQTSTSCGVTLAQDYTANMPNDVTYKHCMQCLALEKMFRPHESRVLHEQKEVERVSIDGRVKRRRPNRDLVLVDSNCIKFLLHPLLVQSMSRVWDGRGGCAT